MWLPVQVSANAAAKFGSTIMGGSSRSRFDCCLFQALRGSSSAAVGLPSRLAAAATLAAAAQQGRVE